MRIGFDISQTGRGKAGCGFYALAMIRALLAQAPGHDFSLYASFGDFFHDPRMPLRNPLRAPNARYGPRHLTCEAASRFWNRPDLEAALGQPDIVHANNFWCPTQLASARLIYTLYDLSFAENPDQTTEVNRVGCFEGVFRAAIAADWVLAISHATREHFLRVFPHFPAERARVIHPCSRFTDTAAQGRRPAGLEALPGGFWLSVGTIEPRKNQLRLAQAYARYLAQGGAPMPLVFAGGPGWLMEDFAQRLKGLGLAGRTQILGYVTDEELVWLYRNCFANLYPSLFEGFGLPVLEGMQFGAPTLSSDAASLPEAGGDAARYIAPTDVEGWAAAMLELAAGPAARARMSEAARAHAARFSWEAAAGALLELYAEALDAPRRGGAA